MHHTAYVKIVWIYIYIHTDITIITIIVIIIIIIIIIIILLYYYYYCYYYYHYYYTYIYICRYAGVFHLGDWFSMAAWDPLDVAPITSLRTVPGMGEHRHRCKLEVFSCWMIMRAKGLARSPSLTRPETSAKKSALLELHIVYRIPQSCSPTYFRKYFPLYNLDHWGVKLGMSWGYWLIEKWESRILWHFAEFQKGSNGSNSPRQEVLDFLGLLEQQPVGWELQEDDKKADRSRSKIYGMVKDGRFWPQRTVGISWYGGFHK